MDEDVGFREHPRMPAASLALVGDRSPDVRAHARIPPLLDGLGLAARWIPTEAAADAALETFDGIWVVPGSPYRSADGAIGAARLAMERGIPYLGTCGGYQHAVLMLARERCGIATAAHAEDGPEGELVIVPLQCSLIGAEGEIVATAGSRFREIMGAERSLERYHCAYGVDPGHAERLTAAGVRFSAHDAAGDVRALELPEHPFFLATLFQPELAADTHPVIRAFAEACRAHASAPAAHA